LLFFSLFLLWVIHLFPVPVFLFLVAYAFSDGFGIGLGLGFAGLLVRDQGFKREDVNEKFKAEHKSFIKRS
jgi:hypothetical protein